MTTWHDTDFARLPGLLIVEPDPALRARLAREMAKLGWRIWVAADASAALETYRQYRNRIDVALVDHQPAAFEAAQLLTELAECNPNLLLCAMSADTGPDIASALREVIDVPLFTKPLAVRALAFTLYEMLIPVPRR